MVDNFVIKFLSELNISPMNGEYYDDLDEVKANYIMVLTILIIISILFIWA